MRADERFLKTLRGEETDRMPVIENSLWWDQTISRWAGEGLPAGKNYAYAMRDVVAIQEHFGLDLLAHWWARPYTERTPFAKVAGAAWGPSTKRVMRKYCFPHYIPNRVWTMISSAWSKNIRAKAN